MAKSDLAVQAAPATDESADRDNQILDKIAKLWETHRKRSLSARQDIGKLLNDRLGPPTERQPRNQQVLKRAAEKLRISESELNRMRWFHYFGQDGEPFWQDVPTIGRTWTKFKAILPHLIATAKGDEAPNGASCNGNGKTVVDSAMRSLRLAISRFSTSDFTVDGTNKEHMIARLRELVSAVSKTCSVRFHLETEDVGNHLVMAEPTVANGCESSLPLTQRSLDAVAV
jgi:hypothetical protein